MTNTLDLFETRTVQKKGNATNSKTSSKRQNSERLVNGSTKKNKSSRSTKTNNSYSAEDIEVLEGLEPVRRRPGMYIGGTDSNSLHHLVGEVLDNSMDEAIAGHATRIELSLNENGSVTIKDNGRGIPVDAHPKFKDRSALEVIMTTLHSGGKFSGKSYATSGGLHGVGLSVVNALSDFLTIEVDRDGKNWRQTYCRGVPLENLKSSNNKTRKSGTLIEFHPDPDIFTEVKSFCPDTVYNISRGKAYLFKGVEIRWSCSPSLLGPKTKAPHKDVFHFPGGLGDYLKRQIGSRAVVTSTAFIGEANLNNDLGRVEWAITWTEDEEGFLASHCNTVATPGGGTHESGLRAGLLRGLKGYGELLNNRSASQLIVEDLMGDASVVLSVFLKNPQFQGQTKDKLTNPEAARLVENVIRDHFEHWLSADPDNAMKLVKFAIDRLEERLRRRKAKEVRRKEVGRKLRLPGKLADCSNKDSEGTELFLVEGDSAGGSAKQARDRKTQAILPLRGKILNVASATREKLKDNQELNDLVQALGCNTKNNYIESYLRYERVVIMTDADVDGAHIASLLMTYFYHEMPDLIKNGHLYLAQPPLYRLSQGDKVAYARDDEHRDVLINGEFNKNRRVEISRFKGLGEMPASQLRETTMDPKKRTLLRITIPKGQEIGTANRVLSLMGRKPEKRLEFIQENAEFASSLDI